MGKKHCLPTNVLSKDMKGQCIPYSQVCVCHMYSSTENCTFFFLDEQYVHVSLKGPFVYGNLKVIKLILEIENPHLDSCHTYCTEFLACMGINSESTDLEWYVGNSRATEQEKVINKPLEIMDQILKIFHI